MRRLPGLDARRHPLAGREDRREPAHSGVQLVGRQSMAIEAIEDPLEAGQVAALHDRGQLIYGRAQR